MKLGGLFTFVTLLLCTSTYAQDTTYIDKYETEIQSRKNAYTYRIIDTDSINKDRARVTIYFINGKIKSTATLVDDASVKQKDRKPGGNWAITVGSDRWLYDGKYMEWYENGKIKKEIDFKRGGINKLLQTYWKNGRVKRIETYNEDWKMLEGECFESGGSKTQFTPYIQSPQYNEGVYLSPQTFMEKTAKYPKSALARKASGKIVVFSKINTKGKITNNVVQHKSDPDLDNEAIRVANSLANFRKPARCDGEPSSYMLILNVYFNLPLYAVNLLETANGQDTIYFDKNGYLKKSRNEAESFQLLTPDKSNPDLLEYSTFYNSGKISSLKTISKKTTVANINKRNPNLYSNSRLSCLQELNEGIVLNGKCSNWYENGQLKSQLNYSNNKVDGEQLYYFENGKQMYQAIFYDGRLVSGSMPKAQETKFLSGNIEESMPQFPGGKDELLSTISSNLRYPVEAQKNGITGTVLLRFIIEIDGSVSSTEILSSVHPILDNEAIRVVNRLPNFSPGMKDGLPVRVWYTLPITFKMIKEKVSRRR